MATNSKGYIGSAPNLMQFANRQPGVPGYVPPTIPWQGNTAGDTVYTLLHSVFDPRTTVSTSGTQVYSSYAPGYQYTTLLTDLLYRRVFAERPGRQEPPLADVQEMIDNMIDIGRMVGIYYTALAMAASADPDMRARARALNLHNTFQDMQSSMQFLAVPPAILALTSKYVGLMDVSASKLYQNVGFLVNGDYDAFRALHTNVAARRAGTNWLRVCYPEIGLLGDPNNTGGADFLQTWVNATYKVGSSGFAVYEVAEGASQEPEQLASAGLLHSVFDSNQIFTATGWAVPGSGFGGVGAVRTYRPLICRWNGTSDAAITYNALTTPYSQVGNTITVQTSKDADLAANLAHEYNLAQSDTESARNVTVYDSATGVASAVDPLAAENVRYRVSSGFGLARISYKYDANQLTFLASVVE